METERSQQGLQRVPIISPSSGSTQRHQRRCLEESSNFPSRRAVSSAQLLPQEKRHGEPAGNEVRMSFLTSASGKLIFIRWCFSVLRWWCERASLWQAPTGDGARRTRSSSTPRCGRANAATSSTRAPSALPSRRKLEAAVWSRRPTTRSGGGSTRRWRGEQPSI